MLVLAILSPAAQVSLRILASRVALTGSSRQDGIGVVGHGSESWLGIRGVQRARHVLEERHARDELERVGVGAHQLLDGYGTGLASQVCSHGRSRRDQPLAKLSIAKVVGGFLG